MRDLTLEEQDELGKNLEERKRLSIEISELNCKIGKLEIRRIELRKRFDEILKQAN